METRKQEFINNLQNIIYKIDEQLEDTEQCDPAAAAVEAASAAPDTIDYEIKNFVINIFNIFEFARINIYVIVNCSSILNDLAKALALLIGLQLKKSIGTAKQDELAKDELPKDKSNKANKV